MINRNALLIIIITLTCAFLLEEEGGEETNFFSLPSPRNQLKKERKNCLQLSLPASDGCTMSRRKQAKPQHIDSDEPASLGNGKFYARGAGVLDPPGKKTLNVQPRRAELATGDILTKFRGGASFRQCSPRTLTCCRPIKLSRSQIQAAFLGSDFFPLSTEHNTGVPRGSFF